MRPTTITSVANGATAWIPVDYKQRAFAVGYTVNVSQGASLTYKIQHGWFNPSDDIYVPINLTRSTTTATATFASTTDPESWAMRVAPKVGDALVVCSASAPFDGGYDIASVSSPLIVTYTVANSGATVGTAGRNITYIRVEDDPIVTGQTASIEGNIAFPICALRMVVSSFVSGKVSLTVVQGY